MDQMWTRKARHNCSITDMQTLDMCKYSPHHHQVPREALNPEEALAKFNAFTVQTYQNQITYVRLFDYLSDCAIIDIAY